MNLWAFIPVLLAAPYYVIKTHKGLVLTVRKGHVGFTRRVRSSASQRIRVEGEALAIGSETICASRTSDAVDMCITENPMDNKFTPVFLGDRVKLSLEGNRVLAVGTFNGKIDMTDAIIAVEGKTDPKKYMFEYETHE